MQEPKRVKVASLWRNVSKNGAEYFTGKLGNLKIVIFANKEKKTDKSPDFSMFFEEVPYEATAAQTQGRGEYQRPQRQPSQPLGTPPPSTQMFGTSFNENDVAF